MLFRSFFFFFFHFSLLTSGQVFNKDSFYALFITLLMYFVLLRNNIQVYFWEIILIFLFLGKEGKHDMKEIVNCALTEINRVCIIVGLQF